MQCPGQYILAGLSQPDMRHSHSSPSTRDRKKNLRKLSHVQTICMIVETAAINTAAQEKYLRNSGSVPSVLNRFFLAKNSSVHGMTTNTPVAMYIPAACSNC